MTALIYGDECVSKDTDKFDQPISRLYDVIILIANPSRFMIIIITAVTDAWRLCQQDRTMGFVVFPSSSSMPIRSLCHHCALMHGDSVSKIGQWGNQSRVSRSSQLHPALSVHLWKCRYKYKRKYKYKYMHTNIQPNTTNEGKSLGSADLLNCTPPCLYACEKADTNISANTNTNIIYTQIFNQIQTISIAPCLVKVLHMCKYRYKYKYTYNHKHMHTNIQLNTTNEGRSLGSADLLKYIPHTRQFSAYMYKYRYKDKQNTNIDTYTTNEGTTLGQLIHPLSSVYSN